MFECSLKRRGEEMIWDPRFVEEFQLSSWISWCLWRVFWSYYLLSLTYDLFVYQYVVQMNKRHDQIIYYVGAPFAEIGIPLRQGKDNVGSVFEQYKDGISLHMRHPSPRVLLEDHFNYWLAVIIALFAIYHLHSFNRQSTLGRCILLLVLVACGMLWTVCSDRLSIPLLFASCL